MRKRAFKAVLFDLDNTLVDFMRMKRASVEAAADAMIDAGLPLPRKKLLKQVYNIYDVRGIEYQKVFQELTKQVKGEIDYKILASGIVAYRRARTAALQPYPNTRSTLIALKKKGVKLGVVSDAPRIQVWTRLVELGLADFFDAVVTLADTKHLKPSAGPFRRALAELDVKPSEALFVGDNPDRDIFGASRLGIATCLAKYGADGKKKTSRHKSDFVINDVKQILGIVK